MTDETAETAREAYERLIKENPRFIEAPRTGQVITIIGGRPRPTVGDVPAPDAGQPTPAHPPKTDEA